MPDHDEALATANLIVQQAKNLIRSTVKALDDKKLSGSEYLRLSMQAAQLGLAIITTIEDSIPEERKALLYVLDHSVLMLECTEVRDHL